MPRAADFMLTAEELRLRAAKRRRLSIIGASMAGLVLLGAFTAKPAGRAIKGFQARRHATRAFEFMEKEKWSEARGEALAAYQLRATEPEALRAVARYLTRTRQEQALDFWKNLRGVSSLSRDDLRDEAAIALMSGELESATRAVNDLLADNGRYATRRDWLIAAQLAIQKRAGADAISKLQNIFHNNTATERELLQAAVLELQAATVDSGEANREAQRDAWTRIVKLAEGKSETALDALMILARRALGSPVVTDPGATSSVSSSSSTAGDPPPTDATTAVSPVTDSPPIGVPQLIAAIEQHPLAKAPHKLIALNLRMHENGAEKEACLTRAIADWKDGDTASLGALAAWLNSHGEFQRELDTIPLEKSLEDRDLFLQHLDALGALGRWDEIKRLLEAERFPIDAVIQRMYLARTNAQLGQKAAAENNWQRALEAAGNDLQKLATLASYSEKNGALDVAGAAYETAAAVAPSLRGIQQGRLRVAQASRDTKKIHAVLAEMLTIWPNDTAIQNDEAYTRLLLLRQKPDEAGQTTEPITDNEELITIEQLAAKLVEREPTSLPHRTLLALARLRQHRPVAALDAYAKIQVAPNSLSPSALAVHAAVLFANGQRDDALKEIAQVPIERLLPEEQAGTADLRPAPSPEPSQTP
ncbi:MAG: hypothetical protein ACJ8EL_12860 [Rhizomicrobium sp.]